MKESPLRSFNINGNYRFYGQHRIFTDNYHSGFGDNNEIEELGGRSILIGDASQLPELTLNVSGSPTSQTTFGTDIVVWNQNTGDRDYYHNVQLGVNLYGSFKTDYANIGVKMGGIHWHSMTSFTMKSFSGYNRFSLFDRNPWDPQFKEIGKRYSEYYAKGAITQDTRFSQQAFQGLILDISELPLGLTANIIYGKTQNAGSAFANISDTSSNTRTANYTVKFYDNTIPNFVYGGRLIKSLGKHQISFNTINHRSYQDMLATVPIDNHIYTSEFNFNFKKISVAGEIGAGKYMDMDMGEMISVKTTLNKKLTKIPIEVHYYRLSPNVINPNAEFVNTSVNEVSSASTNAETVIGSNGVLQQTGSAVLGIGQMANNRQGLNINTDIKIKDLTITLGNGIAKELENLNNQLTYGHAVNGLTMSRFWRWEFPSNVGAYNKFSVLYRGVFETVTLTDLAPNGDVVNDKYFNNVEAQLKYNFKLFKRDWHSFYLGSFASVQPDFSPITVLNEDAYIRVYSHQFENYYSLHPKFIIAQYLGWERIIGNYNTQVDVDSKRPINQSGIGMGLGFDYMMAKNTGLYFRHRWFKYEDTSFVYDKFEGKEATVELKVYF